MASVNMILDMNHTIRKSGSSQPFRTCGSCKKSWSDWKQFLLDTGVRLLGLQASPHLAEANLLVLEHRCGSSISILASRLRHLVPVPGDEAETPCLYGTEMCREHCTRLEDLAACDRPCVNANDRRLVQLLLEIKRRGGPPRGSNARLGRKDRGSKGLRLGPV